jgi:hypothetical protein
MQEITYKIFENYVEFFVGGKPYNFYQHWLDENLAYETNVLFFDEIKEFKEGVATWRLKFVDGSVDTNAELVLQICGDELYDMQKI